MFVTKIGVNINIPRERILERILIVDGWAQECEIIINNCFIVQPLPIRSGNNTDLVLSDPIKTYEQCYLSFRGEICFKKWGLRRPQIYLQESWKGKKYFRKIWSVKNDN